MRGRVRIVLREGGAFGVRRGRKIMLDREATGGLMSVRRRLSGCSAEPHKCREFGGHVVVTAPANSLCPRSYSRPHDCSRFVPVIFCALACADLVSCSVGPDYHPPESQLPAKFAAMSSLKGLGDHNANRPLETTK